MAGILTVVNPRRKRRRKNRRSRTHARATRRRRRRNPVRHGVVTHGPRVRRNRRRRRSNTRHHARRRRHSNPRLFGGMGGIVGQLTKGLGVVAGYGATNLATAYINNKLLGANKQTGLAKTALKAAVGLIALPMLLKFVPGGRKFSGTVAAGAAVAVGIDLYNAYVTPALPADFQDYDYGYIQDYQTGQLQNWPGLQNWAPNGGMQGVDPYSGGAYD